MEKDTQEEEEEEEEVSDGGELHESEGKGLVPTA